MAGINKCFFIGNMGRKADVKYLDNGGVVANFSIAVTKRFKDKITGEKKEFTEWINVVCWNHLAEFIDKYTDKGSSLYVEGEYHTRSYPDKDTGKSIYVTEIVANSIQLLGYKKQEEHAQNYPAQGVQGFKAPLTKTNYVKSYKAAAEQNHEKQAQYVGPNKADIAAKIIADGEKEGDEINEPDDLPF